MRALPLALLFIGVFIGAGLARLENRHHTALELQRGQINRRAKSDPPAIDLNAP